MTETQQLGLAGRVLLWVVGIAIFVVIALLPYALFMQFATDYVVHVTVLSCLGTIALVLLVGTMFGPLRTQPLSEAAATGGGLRFLALVSNMVFIGLQIVLVPLLVIELILLLAGRSLF